MPVKNRACLEPKPTGQTIVFAGSPISLTKIEQTCGVDVSYLSRIFSGSRYPGIAMAQKISAALGMSLEEFITALDTHTKQAV